MDDWLADVWFRLPNPVQDSLVLGLCLLPAVLLGVLLLRGFRPAPLVFALLRRYPWTHLCFVTLLACSVGLGVALIAQERGIRAGSAAAADRFDLVITPPGGDVDRLLATVFLQPASLPLLPAERFQAISEHPAVAMAAPLAFGDSVAGAPLVGTTAVFVQHLAARQLDGRAFTTTDEAVVGAAVGLSIGDRFVAAHGTGDLADTSAHRDNRYRVAGRLPLMGNPWDHAILVPIESVWMAHGLGSGHRPDPDRPAHAMPGPPYDSDYFPGVAAVVVRAKTLAGNYALRSEFTDSVSLAFFPGEVLTRLYALLGNLRLFLAIMAIGTEVLVALSVLTALVVLVRLFARRLALLRAIGAPRRFILAVVWSYAAVLIGGGAVLGLVAGYGLARFVSAWALAHLQLALPLSPGWPELQLVAVFTSAALLFALLPAALCLWRPTVADLRA